MTSAAPAAAPDTATDGPALSLINKRLRALRKKLNRIAQMEESLSQGKILNKEQEETLRSKSSVIAGIDELDKLRQPLLQAIEQEIELAVDKIKLKQEAESGTAEDEIPRETVSTAEAETKSGADTADSVVSDLLNLLYFGTIFDVKTLFLARDNMLTRTHERNCCLTYDCITDDDAEGDLLKEPDLDSIATLGSLLVSRPVNSSLSHKNALQKCMEHAKLWLENAEQPIEPNSNVTYAGLREKLSKIISSEYFTTTPEIKDAVEVAAAGGNYTSFQAPVKGSNVTPVDVADPVEGSTVEYEQEEERQRNFQVVDACIDETGHVEEYNQGSLEVENTQDAPKGSVNAGVDQNSRDVDSREQNATRKPSYHGYRGGRGRRGQSNSRGGRGGGGRGGYQNGRDQFYDQAGGGYYQRNHYGGYRGRGGRGYMSGGSYNNHDHHAAAAGRAQATS